MEYEQVYRLRKFRGFVLGLFGSFIFAFSSVVVTTRQQPAYLTVGALSLSALVMAYFSLKSKATYSQVLFILSGGAILAAEASVVMLYFLQVDAFLYTLATLVGSGLAIRGVMDVESLKMEDYYWRSKREAAQELAP